MKVEEAQHMANIYNRHIDQWIEDSPLTYHQEMALKHGGETLEEMLSKDLDRLEFWKRKQEVDDVL